MIRLKVIEDSELEREAAKKIEAILDQVPFVRNLQIDANSQGRAYDLIAHFSVADQTRTLLVEVKGQAQPRDVRSALFQLQQSVSLMPGCVPVFVAPYLSKEARQICADAGVGYLDLEGNCRITFDQVFIDRAVPTVPLAVKRSLKSPFKPKSAQILRSLMRDPNRAWKVVELAEDSGVSLGQVSNVRSALLDREWAVVDADGLRLSKPGDLLDAWCKQYEPPPQLRLPLYTPKHGRALDEAVKALLAGPGKAALASFSAAEWLAPFTRQHTTYLYVDAIAREHIKALLDTSSPSTGANLVVTRLKDDGLFRDLVHPAPGIATTSPVQTYLDLSQRGDRGEEAAEHLRRERMPWSL